MIHLRRSSERGHLNFGWLETYHTFSFGDYWDRRWMGFRTLRVINEDHIQAAQGFGTHPHRDMEIITYVISGALQHRDSMGNGAILKANDVQRMSAGSGITHSEFNASQTEGCHLLQIWLMPKEPGITPSYEDTTFHRDRKLGRLCPIATSDPLDGTPTIQQDASVFASLLSQGESIEYTLAEGRAAWVQLISGRLSIGDVVLQAGDGAGIEEESDLNFSAEEESEFIFFDLK